MPSTRTAQLVDRLPGAAERAGFMEFLAKLPRDDAERLALDAELDRMIAENAPPGILGGTVIAARHRREFAPDLSCLGLNGRAPAWGFAHIVVEGDFFRPAAAGEFGSAAIIAPASQDGAIHDLAAQTIPNGHLFTRLGTAAVVGADEVEAVKTVGRPLIVYATLTAWLRGGTRGSVIVDWTRAGEALDGVPAILTTQSLASRLHAATSGCWPRPVIAVPVARGVDHAAA